MNSTHRSRKWILSALATLAFAWPATSALAQPELPICRSPGFWQTHGGTEKGAPNIVQALIDEAGGCIEICGEVIETTSIDDADSALEGLCVSPKSGPQIQLARLELAAALSCVISTGHAACLEGSDYCNEACADGVKDSDDTLCQAYLSCTTKGGVLDFSSLGCWLGYCSDTYEPCGTGVPPCPLFGEDCVPYPDNCASAPLLNGDLGLDFDPDPIASSSKACNSATKTSCAIVGPKEQTCDDGNTSEGPESCPTTTTTTTTTTTLPATCEGFCGGGSSGDCYCDAASCTIGDGCADRDIYCPDVCATTTTTLPPRSCDGYCGGGPPPGSGPECYCDLVSCGAGDGCSDRDVYCPDLCTATTTTTLP